MDIIFLHIGPIHKIPPALSVLYTLNDMGKKILLITTDISSNVKKECTSRQIDYYNLPEDPNNISSLLLKGINMLLLRRQLWNRINRVRTKKTLLWVSSFDSLKYMGNKIADATMPYIIHFFEYMPKMQYVNKMPIFRMKEKKICDNAVKTIQCEQNRAYLTKYIWGIKNLPEVIPNKPYVRDRSEKNMPITSSKETSKIMEKLKDKKIVLYQGVVHPERPLKVFFDAVTALGTDYVFMVMSAQDDPFKNSDSEQYQFIPYIEAPLHLEVTSHAHIGILSYFPDNVGMKGTELNIVYCAPNKIFEYSMFGIPMIGNDIPGIANPLLINNIGKIAENFVENDIISAILSLEKEYDNCARNAYNFFDSTNTKEILENKILPI